ncbi:MAG TPA: MFS transporter [Clostridiales bacterium]|nr:MFS transporter [Clostridiales bacterium]
MKLDYRKTFVIGLGFFTVSIIWSIYNVAVPRYLDNLGLSGIMVGTVMTIDNLFALIFLPAFGTLSDRTNTRYGRRMPYLLVGIPLSAIAFFLIPFSRESLPFLMTTVILLNFFMSIYRAPTVALMPDFTPQPLRSKANGIINFMGGLGASVAFLMGGALFKLKEYYPYVVGSSILILTIILMYNFIQEPKVVDEIMEKDKEKDTHKDTYNDKYEGTNEYDTFNSREQGNALLDQKEAKKESGERLSLVFLLLAIFFWFSSFNVVETFFSTYGEKILNVDKSVSSYLLLTVSALFLVFSIPAGLIAGKLGRKRTILYGLIVIIITFISLIFVKTITLMYVLMGIGGISWALININSYPMVVEMTSNKGIGKYTGYYYFFSMLASIVSPILFGGIKDILGDGFLFIYSTIGMIIAFFFMMLVKHGEAKVVVKSAFENLEHME